MSGCPYRVVLDGRERDCTAAAGHSTLDIHRYRREDGTVLSLLIEEFSPRSDAGSSASPPDRGEPTQEAGQ